MSARVGCLAFLGAGMLVSVIPSAAQDVGDRREVLVGAEVRVLSFTRLQSVKRLRQFTVPIGAVVPMGRFTLDIGSAFVSTELERPDNSQHSVSHLIDTQVRGAYVFGHDAVVVTAVVNLPTGPGSASPRDYSVVGAVSPILLGFPVAAYASGFSVTGGLAGAVQAGNWSLGLAGSLRVNSRFTPYADSAGPISYKPGLEGRIRGGADGLVGSGRVSLGFTYSTFGDDQFGKGLTARGQYRPGPRWLAEAALVEPVGSSTLHLSIWNFRRTAGDTTGFSARNRENLASADLSLAVPLSPSVMIEPILSGRMSNPETGRGRMAGAGAGMTIQVGNRVTFRPLARYDAGWVEDSKGSRNTFRGGYVSALARMCF